MEDAELIRALSCATSRPDQIIKTRWDEHVRYNEQSLIDAGILGAPVVGCGKARGLVNGAQLQRLHNGAIWQLYIESKEQADRISTLQLKLNEANDKLARLEMN